ncbi:TIGR02922 family protein [Shewanella sp. 202IG2-18]|uniref:TIGR02922 family protein n=1 Tax=Parashewanella hymeniacidonis TaxID=2807618 RepID=UPI001960F285|nr:TIGR02922 family protein [Parashewanella hymeniacidonis]MBM7071036.1 TIGR02922 family protein [Parashewanella hymeniacidonis]
MKSQVATVISTKTVTVLFYDAPVGLLMRSEVLRDLSVGSNGRVIIPQCFRQHKSIVAILEGDCKVLNALGDRAAETAANE